MGYTIWINLHHKISIQTLENAAASGPQRPLMHCLINCCSHRRWQGVFQSRSSHTGNISCSGSWHSIHADLSTETSTGRLLLEILSKLCRSISNASLGPSFYPSLDGAFTMDKKKPQCFTKVFCTSDSSLAVTTGGSAPSENGADLLDKAIECLLEKNFHMLKINDKIPEANKMYVSSWIFVQLVYSSYASFVECNFGNLSIKLRWSAASLNLCFSLCLSDETLCRVVRLLAELLPQQSHSSRSNNSKKKRMEQLNLNFHHAVSPFTTQFLRNVAYFLLATSALYMPTASEVSFRPRLIQLILCLSGGVTWKATHVGCRIQGLGVIDRSHGESPVSE